MTQEWWHDAIIYQIYPKSFQDTTDDGVGDVPGIIARLDYIQSLGVNMIWLNPIFISPQVDNGYDISNYYAIDSLFGTMADVDQLIYETHERGIKVVFDFVLNHTSTQHPWFQEALKGPDNMYRDYYLWQKGTTDGQPPNNWASFFGGSVWEKEKKSDEYYFHLFDKEMPDLNWANVEVRKAMTDIALFWLEKGIDGFRLDAFIHIAKADFSKQVARIPKGEVALAEEYYANLPRVTDYLEEFIGKLQEVRPDIFILGEAASATPSFGNNYTKPNKSLCQTVVSFDYFQEKVIETNKEVPKEVRKRELDVPSFKKSLKAWQEELVSQQMPTLYWNNHDMPRAISRYGNDETYRIPCAKMMATLMYLQRGVPILLYGEEIGMKNLEIQKIDAFQSLDAVTQYIQLLEAGFDKKESLARITMMNKEASRGCMQWDDSEYSGFSTVPPWSGVNEERSYTVKAEQKNQDSILVYYQQVLKLKQRALFTHGDINYIDTEPQLIVYDRTYKKERARVICNFSEKPINISNVLVDNQKLILSNHSYNKHSHELLAYGAIVLND